MILSIDCESTGLDFRHGSSVFFVTTCDGEGNQQYWEWDVDPLTRRPTIPQEDVQAIQDLIDGADEIVGQNLSFDIRALSFVGIKNWPWDKTHDTLIAGHLLSSNTPHNLTDMAIQYLGVDIEPLELELEKCVKECRRVVQQAKLRTKRGKESSEFSDWYIADGDDPTMPSVSEKSWKADMWLPRAMDPTSTALADYSNADSSVTVSLWKVMEKKLKERNLWAIYQQRMKLLPVSIKMESRGITVSADRLNELTTKYQQESDEAHARCVDIAKGYGYDLELPKSSMNKNLSTFCFEVMKLQPLRNPKAKTENPTFNKAAVEHYLSTLRPNSRELRFVQSLSGKRSRDTALGYMQSYQRFWRAVEKGWYRLHPSLNCTGTDTLRWSCQQPNEQNISKKEGFNLRYAFGPAPGREWWSLDAKNIELRLPAYESGEEEMIALFEQPNDAPYYGSNHLLIAHILHPELFEACRDGDGNLDGRIFKKKYESTWYKRVKNGNFAVLYGAVDKPGGWGTADRAYGVQGAQSRIKSRLAKMEELNQKCIRFANKHGYVETMPDRTVDPDRGYPINCTRTEYGRILETVPLNYHIQGTAMQWMNKAMVRVQAKLDEWRKSTGFDGYLIMQVHDELVFDFEKSKKHPKEVEHDKNMFRRGQSNLWRIRIIQKLMEQGGEDVGIPTPVSAEFHEHNWSEGVTF